MHLTDPEGCDKTGDAESRRGGSGAGVQHTVRAGVTRTDYCGGKRDGAAMGCDHPGQRDGGPDIATDMEVL